MYDPIRQILKQTDLAMPAPVAGRNLAQRVRRRARNQRLIRTVAAGVMVVAVGILSVTAMRNHPHPLAQVTLPAKDDLKWAEVDAKYHQLVADLLEKHERETVRPVDTKADEYLWQLSQQGNRAALILVRSADRIYQESHDRAAAEASYRQAIRLFPDSPAAAVAQQRLRNIDANGSES
ncbi:MAG: hypothetical protein ABSH08_11115 [Tepidisphaeraceae bacterium]|jgi:hypothetical protein